MIRVYLKGTILEYRAPIDSAAKNAALNKTGRQTKLTFNYPCMLESNALFNKDKRNGDIYMIVAQCRFIQYE